MTRCDDFPTTSPSDGTSGRAPCDCERCRSGDLPVNPSVALRVAYGMLLGEEDFRALMGNPRGKHMLHSAWLHGSGVVWGFDVVPDGAWGLKVSEGLAVDAVGRELRHEASECLDVRAFVKATQHRSEKECESETIEACLVAEFDSCLSDPVPTLADPCDVTRKHDDYSRVVERVRLSLRAGCCPPRRTSYHRVRVLLGLDRVRSNDPAGDEAIAARQAVAAAPAKDRPHELMCQFRRLSALDSIDLRPAEEAGDCYPTLFPETEEESGVVLACIRIHVRERDGCAEITIDPGIDTAVRTALLPTAAIQELTCGLAPGLIGEESSGDAGGPRVIGEGIELSADGKRLVIPVTAPLARGSVPGSVGITSLSPGKPGGWVVEDLYDTKYDTKGSGTKDSGTKDDQHRIIVDLADRPVNDLIRLVVKGTGPKPVLGESGVPLAGLVGGPPGGRHDGLDAVWTFANPVAGRDERATALDEVEDDATNPDTNDEMEAGR